MPPAGAWAQANHIPDHSGGPDLWQAQTMPVAQWQLDHLAHEVAELRSNSAAQIAALTNEVSELKKELEAMKSGAKVAQECKAEVVDQDAAAADDEDMSDLRAQLSKLGTDLLQDLKKLSPCSAQDLPCAHSDAPGGNRLQNKSGHPITARIRGNVEQLCSSAGPRSSEVYAQARAPIARADLISGGTGGTACIEAAGAGTTDSGHNLLSMLRGGTPILGGAVAGKDDPHPMSLDEFKLWEMEAREDRERGADLNNVETFGVNTSEGWGFEENLAANNRINVRPIGEDASQASTSSGDKASQDSTSSSSSECAFIIVNEGKGTVDHAVAGPAGLEAEADPEHKPVKGARRSRNKQGKP
eukprot:gnl/TRDRNA2_/TRDRNA2_87345_c0_seq1.p1 gnl/TRDRNA2_/TRDRNA2_87345_c0~~gnl/TRDRNA2_/TRDRNA2_87345_c0_seq1.p1  ORF type:complete len:358 (-),score=88.49 gnl/TRDRNA2_/TRDRNA2_87345_c0_seq1:163-1236(-)